jgi:hypothetical protein
LEGEDAGEKEEEYKSLPFDRLSLKCRRRCSNRQSTSSLLRPSVAVTVSVVVCFFHFDQREEEQELEEEDDVKNKIKRRMYFFSFHSIVVVGAFRRYHRHRQYLLLLPLRDDREEEEELEDEEDAVKRKKRQCTFFCPIPLSFSELSVAVAGAVRRFHRNRQRLLLPQRGDRGEEESQELEEEDNGKKEEEEKYKPSFLRLRRRRIRPSLQPTREEEQELEGKDVG